VGDNPQKIFPEIFARKIIKVKSFVKPIYTVYLGNIFSSNSKNLLIRIILRKKRKYGILVGHIVGLKQ
jgi:hypothetical protein